MQKPALLAQILALIALSAFSGALLFIAFVVVRFWLSAEPDVFLAWMAGHFFRFPRLMVPMNALALLTTIAAVVSVWKQPAARLTWGLGLMCLLLGTITFPIYFASANTEFVTGAVAFNDVTAHVETWSQWHWGRTGLALLAVVFAGWGFVQVERTTFS